MRFGSAITGNAKPSEEDEKRAHRRQIPLLGVPVSYESESAEVLDVIADALGAWRGLDRAPWLVETRGIHVRIVVVEDEEPARDSEAAGEAERELADAAGESGIEDGLRREACVRVPRGALEEPALFRYGRVETVTLALLARFDRTPVRAAAVTRDGAALLLAGPGGAGKSSLAYAAAASGLKVLADDVVHVQMRPELRVWGMPGSLHLPADAWTHFPELTGIEATRLADGETKVTLDVARLGALPELPLARRAGVCLLLPEDGVSRLEMVDRNRLLSELGLLRGKGLEAYPAEAMERIGRLAENGAWLLNVGGSPLEQVPHLHAMLDAVEGRGEPPLPVGATQVVADPTHLA